MVIQDYPMGGRPVYLHMRKNKWWDKSTNEIFSYNLELPNEEGTRLSREFVVFLKMKVETTALSIKHIAQMYCVNGKHFADVYRNRVSGYHEWWIDELSQVFYNANVVNDRLHVQQVYNETLDEIRIDILVQK